MMHSKHNALALTLSPARSPSGLA